jgi:hypothetical protein
MFFTFGELSITTLGAIIVPAARPIILILSGSASGSSVRIFKALSASYHVHWLIEHIIPVIFLFSK